MIEEAPLLYEARDGIASLTLNRPRVLNALNLAMRDALWEALDAVVHDPDVGVVILRGAGDRAFSAGADLNDFGTAPSLDSSRRARIERDLWSRLYTLEKPTIAVVHGYALGAGCELALLCDLRIAAEDARFGLPEVGLGYVPSAGGSQTLPRLVGPSRAAEMILAGEQIDAHRAQDYGLVERVVPPAELISAAEALARRVLDRPAASVRVLRRSLREGLDLSLDAALRLDAAATARYFATR